MRIPGYHGPLLEDRLWRAMSSISTFDGRSISQTRGATNRRSTATTSLVKTELIEPEGIRPVFFLRRHESRALRCALRRFSIESIQAIRLDGGDADLAEGMLIVRHTKFNRPGWSRCTEPRPLRSPYLRRRDRLLREPCTACVVDLAAGTRLLQCNLDG